MAYSGTDATLTVEKRVFCGHKVTLATVGKGTIRTFQK